MLHFSCGGVCLFWPRQLSYRGGRPQDATACLLGIWVWGPWNLLKFNSIRPISDSIKNSELAISSPMRLNFSVWLPLQEAEAAVLLTVEPVGMRRRRRRMMVAIDGVASAAMVFEEESPMEREVGEFDA
ncbi:unnamed protein product [Citrullus colocynthis]|uniref:Uncharacterized protein n=1 Tax=Citrullus colocynthis TaxID=252529 RepID=A0ABP0YC10_9ROSI